MNLKDMEVKLTKEIIEGKLKVETTYCELVEAGKGASASLEQAYLEAIDELNAKLAEARALALSFRAKARSFAKSYGMKIERLPISMLPQTRQLNGLHSKLLKHAHGIKHQNI